MLTCELFCAGITSNKILDEYRALREKKVGAKLIAFNVRNKEKGWFVQHIQGRIPKWESVLQEPLRHLSGLWILKFPKAFVLSLSVQTERHHVRHQGW